MGLFDILQETHREAGGLGPASETDRCLNTSLFRSGFSNSSHVASGSRAAWWWDITCNPVRRESRRWAHGVHMVVKWTTRRQRGQEVFHYFNDSGSEISASLLCPVRAFSIKCQEEIWDQWSLSDSLFFMREILLTAGGGQIGFSKDTLSPWTNEQQVLTL